MGGVDFLKLAGWKGRGTVKGELPTVRCLLPCLEGRQGRISGGIVKERKGLQQVAGQGLLSTILFPVFWCWGVVEI